MTAAGTSDTHSPDLLRVRVVEWQAPGPVAKAALPTSGIEAMRAIRDGRGNLAVHATATFFHARRGTQSG